MVPLLPDDIARSLLHPSVAHFIPLFAFEDLPTHKQPVARRFAELAAFVMLHCAGQEAGAGLRKLLEARDCALRASLYPASVDGGSAT